MVLRFPGSGACQLCRVGPQVHRRSRLPDACLPACSPVPPAPQPFPWAGLPPRSPRPACCRPASRPGLQPCLLPPCSPRRAGQAGVRAAQPAERARRLHQAGGLLPGAPAVLRCAALRHAVLLAAPFLPIVRAMLCCAAQRNSMALPSRRLCAAARRSVPRFLTPGPTRYALAAPASQNRAPSAGWPAADPVGPPPCMKESSFFYPCLPWWSPIPPSLLPSPPPSLRPSPPAAAGPGGQGGAPQPGGGDVCGAQGAAHPHRPGAVRGGAARLPPGAQHQARAACSAALVLCCTPSCEALRFGRQAMGLQARRWAARRAACGAWPDCLRRSYASASMPPALLL